MKNKKWKFLCVILTPIIILILGIYFKASNIPATVYIRNGQTIQSNCFISFDDVNKETVATLANNNTGEKFENVNIFGIIPVKSVYLKSIPDMTSVYLGGQPIGVKLNTKGVLIVSLSDIETSQGKIESPAATAGLQIGDSIIDINDNIVNNSEDVQSQITSSGSKVMIITIDRKGILSDVKVKPIKSNSDENYKIGLWIRDSTAGIGTLTFYDGKTKKFGALGHAITDVDTNTILKVGSGQIVSASIISIKKGLKGMPGELKGIFTNEDNILGKINRNSEYGISGESNVKLTNKEFSTPIKIALRNEIKVGPAKVLTTIDGTSPKLYDLEILKIMPQVESGSKSMLIKITDPELLSKTGGIVQGMSGSPIIQGDKLVGAVTHVLINKPDTGYGVFIESMLKDTGVLSN